MPAVVDAMLGAAPVVLAKISTTDRLSFVMGCQIYENYTLKSTDGLSIWFILIWLGGDVFNLVGGRLQGVLWTMINLAGYYCLCDLLLIAQWWYYGKYYHDGEPIANLTDSTEGSPLLGGSMRRSWTRVPRPVRSAYEHVVAFFNQFTPTQFAVFKYSVTIAFVVITGIVAWFSADESKMATSSLELLIKGKKQEAIELRWDAQLLGWLSATLYFFSRIPQIFKNRHTKCAGLSLALFVFAVGGNVSYVLSIVLKDQSRGYLIENASWIMGSVGTIFLDFIVLGQFIVYAPARREIEAYYHHQHS